MPTERVAPANPALGRVVGVIPARLASTRLPRKVLRQIAGRPLLAWVVDAARACPALEEVVVATDSDEVEVLCRMNGWKSILTDPALPSGTDRLYVVSQQIAAAIYVNIQGDEPLLRPDHIDALLQPFADAAVDVATLKTPLAREEADNPNIVKVVTALDGRALYFSRSAIPFDRDGAGSAQHFKHLGLYAYRAAALSRFAAMQPSELEQTERLEQLRMLENGMSLYVSETAHDTIGVDTEDDLRQVEQLLRLRSAI